MQQELSDALKYSIESYLSFFDSSASLGIAMFGACLFVVVRAVGLILDKEFAKVNHLYLIAVSAVCALIMILTGYLAHNAVLAFSTEVMMGETFGHCVPPADSSPTTFFRECHRYFLRLYAQINVVASILGIVSIGVWFLLQTRRIRNA